MPTVSPAPVNELVFLRERRMRTRRFRAELEQQLRRLGADNPELTFSQYGWSRFLALDESRTTPVVRGRWNLEDLVVLCYGATQGYTFAQIARVLGRTPAAVRQRAYLTHISVFGAELVTRRDLAILSRQDIRRVDRAMRKAGMAPGQRVLDTVQHRDVLIQLCTMPRRKRCPHVRL